jgi:serine/threonine protein kinase
MIRKTLGHYEITSQLGKGGMGEVYRAKDQKLGRDVAIKVLPEEFAKDDDRVARFQREAKLLASLNHANIAAIYGLEEADGTHFIVLELVEGDTLADRLKRGAIPVEESLKLAFQIAEALEAAHEKGVIHRDLKPANIKVTPDGKVKVLDFGLAKAYAGDREDVNLSNSPTLSEAATQQGIILGTAAYMSPEQARGEAVDKRADIWAFGVVLFEMLTGRGMFEGRTVSDTLAAVLMREPEWKRLPANLNPRIRLLLEHCLEKEGKNRCSGIGEARLDIQKVLADPSGVLVKLGMVGEPRRKLRTILPWAAATLVLGLIIAGVAAWKLKPTPPPEPRQVMRFYHDLPEGQQLSDLYYYALAVSPDGKKFVYSTLKGLYMRSVNELTAKLISGTEENTQSPFFSPDGKWVGYFSPKDFKLKKIAANGGAAVALCDVRQPWRSWWNEDDTILYCQFGRDIMRISANGGTPESVVKLKSGSLNSPQILPNGKSILYTSTPSSAQPKIMIQSLKSGETKELFSGSDARYLPTGHIVYRLPNNSNLFAIPFNLDRLEVTGGGVPIVEGVIDYAVSSSGTLAYIPEPSGGAQGRRTLVWVNREGKEEPLSIPPNAYYVFRISPDGKRVALHVASVPKGHLWIWDVVRETLTRLTFDEDADNCDPLWTLDGKRIVYTSSRENIFLGNGDICWKAADGTGEAEKLASSPSGRALFPRSWSRDGKSLVVWEYAPTSNQVDIGMITMEGDHARKPLLQEKYSVKDPRVSPEGRWMAYASNESGKYEVYVRPFPDVNKGKWQVSTSGGNTPLWSPDGREIYYRSGDAAMAVPVETEPTFKPGKPAVLFRGTNVSSRGIDVADFTYWDINPDGKRFLMLEDAAVEGPRKINIVLNWLEELKQRVPVK